MTIAAAGQHHATYGTISDPDTRMPLRVYTAPVVDKHAVIGVVQVMQTLARTRDALGRLLTALLVSVPVLVIVAGLAGYSLAYRALAPIDHITRTARRISAEDLSARLRLSQTDDEVGRLAATLDAMLARLEESFQRERRFTADASHELRTPLAAMQAILSVMSERRCTPEEYEQASIDLSGETERLRCLTDSLLQLARDDTRQSLSLERVELSTLLGDVAESLQPLAEAKGLALKCDIPAGLELVGDRDGLIRLFANLLDNAIKYTQQGEVRPHARRRGNDAIRVSVSDTGCGIAAEHLTHLFDRFYRVDASRSEPGAGLGLAIALEIAQAHNGRIKVASKVGVGTTFTVWLAAA